MPVAFRLFGATFLALVASVHGMAFSVFLRVRRHSPALPGLSPGAVVGSLVAVGSLSYLWTRRVWVAVGMVIASIFVTALAFFLLLLWGLGSSFE